MRCSYLVLSACLSSLCLVLYACASEETGGVFTPGKGGSGGKTEGGVGGTGGSVAGGGSGGTATGGSGGTSEKGGSGGEAGTAGTSAGGSGGTSTGGSGGTAEGGSGGTSTGGSGGTSVGGSGGTSTGGQGGKGGTGGGGGGSPNLGAKCTSNSNCGGGLICLQSTGNALMGGGPAGGLCSIDCSADPSLCETYETGAICLQWDETGTVAYCIQGCTLGPEPAQGEFGQFDPNKCRGRQDMACTEFDTAISGCVPTCQKDSECGARKCDPRDRICVNTAHTGTPMGGSCRQWALSEGDAGVECAGICLGVLRGSDAGNTDPLNVAYFCSERCVYGDLTGCGYENATPAGLCIYAVQGTGNGDQAFCGQLCDVDADCLDSADNPFCDTEWVQYVGRGLCGFHYGNPDGG